MDERLNRIQAFLKKNNTSIEALTKGRIAQFEKVDDAIQAKLQAITQAQETLKATSINVSVISTDTGISRKTFYNNDLLRQYVESYATIEATGNVASTDYNRVKEKNDTLVEQVQALVLKDIDNENLRRENTKLQREIINLTKHVKNIEEQYECIQKENAELQRKLSKKSCQIIQMPFFEEETPLSNPVVDTTLVEAKQSNPIDLMLGISAGTTNDVMNGLTTADLCKTKTVMLYCDNSRFRTSSFMVANGYNIVLHGPLNVNLASDNPSKRKQAIAIVESIIRRCNEVSNNIKCLVLHPGSAVDPSYLYNSLEYLLPLAKFNIAIETMAGKGVELLSTLDEMKEIQEHFSGYSNFGFCLDTCHMNDAGIDLSDFDKTLHVIGAKIDLKKVYALHINDSKNPIESHKDRHANIGTGYIPLDTLKAFAQAKVFASIPKILETPQKEQELSYPDELAILTSR